MPSSNGLILSSVPRSANSVRRGLCREARVALAHRHLICALIRARREHRQIFADRPKAQEPDAEFALQFGAAAIGLEPPLDRVADVRGDVLEVGKAVGVARHAVAVVTDREVVLAVLAPARDRNSLGTCVDAVLDELRDGLQGIALRERDDANRVPVVADAQLAAFSVLRVLCVLARH
jgi:hypothetical protein